MENDRFLPALVFVLFYVALITQSARAEGSDTSRAYVYNLGSGAELVLNNSLAWADFEKVFSIYDSPIDAHFWAYELRSEFVAWNRYSIQASFLTGASRVDAPKVSASTMSNLILIAGVGYRFSQGPGSSGLPSYRKHNMMAFVRYRYIGHFIDSKEGIAGNSLQIGVSSSNPTRLKFLVVDAAVWLTAAEKYSPRGNVSFTNVEHQTVGMNLGIGIELSQYATLGISEELNQEIPNIFHSRFQILSITIRTMI